MHTIFRNMRLEECMLYKGMLLSGAFLPDNSSLQSTRYNQSSLNILCEDGSSQTIVSVIRLIQHLFNILELKYGLNWSKNLDTKYEIYHLK